MGRVVVLAGAAAAAALAVARPAGRDVRTAPDHYRCPMHAEVDSAAPAACPICGMALVRERATHGTAAAADAPVARVARRIVSEAVRAPAWVEADGSVVAMVYRDDVVGISPDQPAVMYPASAPSLGVEVALTDQPATDWDRSTTAVHFRVVARAARADGTVAAAGRLASPGGDPDPAVLRPGEQGLLVIAGRPRELLVVPAGAVLQAPESPYVLALDPVSRQLVPRPVQIGRTNHGVTAVLSGVLEGEPVVASGAFFIDVDARGRGSARGAGGAVAHRHDAAQASAPSAGVAPGGAP